MRGDLNKSSPGVVRSEKSRNPALPGNYFEMSSSQSERVREIPEEDNVYFQPYFARPGRSGGRFSNAHPPSPPFSPAVAPRALSSAAGGQSRVAVAAEQMHGDFGGGSSIGKQTAGFPSSGVAGTMLGMMAHQFVSTASHSAIPITERDEASQEGRVPSQAEFLKAALDGSARFAQRMGTFVAQEGGRLLERSNLTGDGPKPLRALCFLGGLAIIVLTGLQTLNVFMIFTSPTGYFLQLFLLFFGVTTCVVEAKDIDALERAQPFFSSWFKFLTVPLGKGLFYMLTGAMAMSLWTVNVLFFAAGAYMAMMGVMWVMVHLGMRHHLQQRGIDVSSGGASPRGSVGLGQHLNEFRVQQPLYQMPDRQACVCNSSGHVAGHTNPNSTVEESAS